MEDFFKFVTKDILGSGLSRTVYSTILSDDLVIKKEEEYFQNIQEWLVWQELKDTPLAKYLAPCIEIQQGGKYLLMAKTTPFYNKSLEIEMPSFITDEKTSNFGMYEGRIVCHDYGFCKLFGSKKLRKITLLIA